MEADVQADGAGHQQVVVLAVNGAITAVLPSHIGGVFVEASRVALHIQSLPHGLYQRGDDFGLGLHVGVEPIFHGCPPADVLGALLACIEMGIDIADGIEDVRRLVAALQPPVVVVGLERVRLDDKQGIASVMRNAPDSPVVEEID